MFVVNIFNNLFVSSLQKLTNGKDNWSISEVVHALVLLSHFHALSSFVYGCGITPEVDHDGGYTYNGKSPQASVSNSKLPSPSSSFKEVFIVLGCVNIVC